ncbi:hypothetical protein ACOZE3_01350 [Streptomyces cinereoruber]|uniref:hypothetical protein n=1 Tax=Streptomyces cinereoruber TaxID=67260 RepID=UPI003BF503EF
MRILNRLMSAATAMAVVTGTLAGVITGAPASHAVTVTDGTPPASGPFRGMVMAKKTASVGDDQAVTVSCPPGQVPISGGAYATVGQPLYSNMVALVESMPAQNSQGAYGWTASARSGPKPLTVTVHAVCIYAPAGYEVAEQYHFTIDRNAPLVTTCPTGKVAFGGGGTVYGGTRNLNQSYPGPAGSAHPNQWIVSGYDVHAEQLRVDGYAICADPIAGLTTTRYTHTTSDDVAGGVLQCATDKKVVGGGAAVTGYDDTLVTSRPLTAAESGGRDGWQVQATGNNTSHGVDLYVTCY